MRTFKSLGFLVTAFESEAEFDALPNPNRCTYVLEKFDGVNWVECGRNHHGAFGTVAPKNVVCRVINLNTGNQIGHNFTV